MKLFKLSLAAAVAALVVGTVPVARATVIPLVPDGTYYFYATDGDTALDGSNITFANDVPVSWYLLDKLENGSSVPPSTNPLTPANSQLDPSDPFAGVYGPNEWAFNFISNTLAVNFYDFYEAGNNLAGPGVGQLYDGYGDPIGTWGPARASVPDASGTFQLFAGALTALGTCKAFLRGRAASRR
jgi:hypothetical protein